MGESSWRNNFCWWQRGIIYQVYPRSFMDSNGDGIGDLGGIRRKLDYLQWLGVDAIWISPIYPSPMADFGYDISNYTDIDPIFGTLAEFDALLDDVHGRGMKLLLDYVPNHTSDRHPWFIDARASRSSPRRDWYAFEITTFERERCVCPNTFDHTKRLQRHLSLVIPRHIVCGKTERADTGAKTALQTSFSQVVEHCDFFRNPDRIPEWQHIDQRSQTDPFGALRGRAEKTAGARTLGKTHIKMVLGDKIKIHPVLVGRFDDLEMTFIKVSVGAPRNVVLLHVIE